MVVLKLLMVPVAVLMTAALTSPSTASAAEPAMPAAGTAESATAEPEFTPLDAIERVRQAGCGINDFEEFLAWYSSATESGGWLEQVIFTSYMVNVGKLADPSGPGYWVDREQYLGQFRISGSDYRFSREVGSGPLPPEYSRISLTRVGDKKYRVGWQGGLPFAGVDGADRDAQAGAYIFEHKKDCWYLTGDLR